VDPSGEFWQYILAIITIWGVYEIVESTKEYVCDSYDNLQNKEKEFKMCDRIVDPLQRQLCYHRVVKFYSKKQRQNSVEYGKSVTGRVKTFGYKHRK